MISRLSVILLGAGYGKRFASLQPKQNYKIMGKTCNFAGKRGGGSPPAVGGSGGGG